MSSGGTLRLSVVIDGQTREAVVRVNEVKAALNALEGQAGQSAAATSAATTAAAQNMARTGQLTSQQLTNMQFQMQDMAVGLASGQSPFTVLMQQGSQLVQSFQSGTGVMAAMKSVGGGIVSFLTNPLNLALLAFSGGAAVVSSFFASVSGGVEDTDVLLEHHRKQIELITAEYKKAEGQALAYAKALGPTMLLQLQQSRTDWRGKIFDARESLGGQLPDMVQSRTAWDDQVVFREEGATTFFERLSAVVTDAAPKLAQGTISADAVLRQLNDIASAAPESAVELRNFAAQLAAELEPLRQSEEALRENGDAIKMLTGTADEGKQAYKDLSGEARKSSGHVEGLSRSIAGLGAVNPFAMPMQGFAQAPKAPGSGMSLLDLIGTTEGTDRGRGYNETLNYGRFTGGDVDLVTMTLRQVMDLQRQMLAHPDNNYNSSALGRYQITRETLQDFMPKLGLSGDTVFSPEVQDKIALAIANSVGRDAQALNGRWPSLLARATPEVVLGAYDKSSGARSGVAQAMSKAEVKSDVQDTTQAQRFAEAIRQQADATTLLAEAQGRSAAETARARTEQRLWTEARRIYGAELETNAGLHDKVAAAITREANAAAAAAASQEANSKALKDYARNAEDMAKSQEAVSGLFRGFGSGLVSEIARAREAGESWTKAFGAGLDMLRNKGLSLLDSFIARALDAALVGGQGSGGGGLLNAIFGLFNPMQNATGNVFAGEHATGFAKGSSFANTIVTQPTLFRFAHGQQLGEMGEAGPEGIFPLIKAHGTLAVGARTGAGETALPVTRLASGNLGIDASTLAALQPPQRNAAGNAFAAGGVFDLPSFAPPVARGGDRAAGGAASGGRGIGAINIHNYSGAPVETRRQDHPGGDFDLEIIVGDMVGRQIAEGRHDGPLQGRFGLSQPAQTWG